MEYDAFYYRKPLMLGNATHWTVVDQKPDPFSRGKFPLPILRRYIFGNL
ncbi:unnamed protein product [Amoebophrya sp. A120]|nr:unnamed protein product [Amoebophrya sp. A120]|eukprot:GSA120T00024876001.1